MNRKPIVSRPEIVRLVENFVRRAPVLSPGDAERELLNVLRALYSERFTVHALRDGGVDFVAIDPDASECENDGGRDKAAFGLEFKHLTQKAGIGHVRQADSSARKMGLDSVILLCGSGFTTAAWQEAVAGGPRVQLLDFDGLMRLARDATAADRPPERVGEVVAAIIEYASREFAKEVAKNPRALDHIEWRDVERMMTEVFAGIGFQAELTPGSKDGGKDVILTLSGNGTRRTFIVELKHWRSGKGVGAGAVNAFVEVVANEKRDGGLFLSTHGFAADALSSLTEIERRKVRFGEEEKIQSLCRTYVRARAGLWCPRADLAETLFENT